MKTKHILILTTIVSVATTIVSALDINFKDYKEIRIEYNLSESVINKSMKKIKEHGLKAIVDPKFNCKSIGYSKDDIFASGTMYGTNRKDGGIDISGTGDFKAYSYIRYIKDDKECIEKSYTKEYDPNRYGEHSIAILFKNDN